MSAAAVLTLTAALTRDKHDAVLPESLVNHVVLVTTRVLFAAAPGKRSAAIAAAWSAATDTEANDGTELKHAFATYRQVEHELRVQLRTALGRAADTEPEAAVRLELGRMLHRLASFEALATWIPARAEAVKRRRGRR